MNANTPRADTTMLEYIPHLTPQAMGRVTWSPWIQRKCLTARPYITHVGWS